MKQFPPNGNEPSPILIAGIALLPIVGIGAWLIFG
ncbi:MAG: hypothetical protein OJF48_001910 [Afipia sp.]|jgi:hypothetical protein|nr:MAG: hypothetical protein OJF48_001910 [Afipia sp.]